MRSDFDPKEKELAKFLEDWLLMQQKLYGSQHMWGVEGDAKAADIFAWMLANGQYYDRDLEKTNELKEQAYYEPQLKQCYHNALMMGSEGLTYCEGWMVGEQIPIPISHAWNILDNQVIDFTSTLWGRDDETRIYFGVVIPQEFVMQQMMETGVSGPYLYPYIMTQLNESSNSLAAESRVVTMKSNSDNGDNYYCTRCEKGFSSIIPTDEGQFCEGCLPTSATPHDEMDATRQHEEFAAEESELSRTLANMERELGIDSEDYEDYGKYTNPTARLNAAISKIEREFDVNEEDFQYRGLKKDAEEFGAESCTCNDMFGSLCPQCNYDSDREGGVCPKGCTVDLAGSVRPQEMEIYTECKIHGQKLGAEEFAADRSRYGNRYLTRNKQGQFNPKRMSAESPSADSKDKKYCIGCGTPSGYPHSLEKLPYQVGLDGTQAYSCRDCFDEVREAESFNADRSRYGNRYLTRNKQGQFKNNVSVGRSLSADRRIKSKNVPSKRRRGQQGDYRAEETDEIIYLVLYQKPGEAYLSGQKDYLVGNEKYIRKELDDPFFYSMDGFYDDEEKRQEMLDAYDTMSIEDICLKLDLELVQTDKNGLYIAVFDDGKLDVWAAETFGADSDIASLEMWQQVVEDNPNDEEAQGQFDYWWSRVHGGRDKPVFKVNEERKWFENLSNGGNWNGPNVLTNDTASFYRSCAVCNTEYDGGGIHYWSDNDFSVCEECWNEKDGGRNANYMQAESFAADRSRYGNRYLTRNKQGQFKTNVSVGRSLSADRRIKSKNVPSKRRRGQQGDYSADQFAATDASKIRIINTMRCGCGASMQPKGSGDKLVAECSRCGQEQKMNPLAKILGFGAESFNADEIEETDQEIAESVLFSCDDCGSMYGRGAGDVLICSRLGQEGHYNHCAGCCPDTESFGAESDATSTMKSILYTLATVGAGVFVFNKYVKDRLPSNGDE